MTATRPKPKKLPKLRRQKEKGRPDRAFVVLDERRIPCGRWGTDEAQRRYDRVIAEWLAGGRRLPVKSNELITLLVVADRYLSHVAGYYVHRNGTPTKERQSITRAVQVLLELYADLSTPDFGPGQLRAVQQNMISRGWCRSFINQQVGRIRRMFRWAVAHELYPADALVALKTVEGLKAGRSEAPETDPIMSVADAVVDATLEHLTPTLRAMVELQRLTGMRPAEVCKLTTGMIDTSSDVWTATLTEHKTSYRGRKRVVFLGPKAKEELQPWLRPDLAAPLFSPIQSDRERREALRQARRTPASCGNGPGDNRLAHPRRQPAKWWNTQSYGRAIVYACDAAFPPPAHLARQRVEAEGRKGERWETAGEWRGRLKVLGLLDELARWRREHRWASNQLRHSYATRVRRGHGLEAAQVLLGHAKADVTQVYAERDYAKAIAVAKLIG